MILSSAFPFLAPLGAGELIGHYILRNARYTTSASSRMVFKELLGRKPGLNGMPSGLGHFHEVVGHVFGSLEMLLDGHTELNWYCRGLPVEKYAQQRRNLVENLKGPVRLCRPEVTLGATDGVERYCPECEEIQLRDNGFRYVHRELCAPYVVACRVHGIELRWKGKQGRLFDAECHHPLEPSQLSICVEFARRTAHCLNTTAENGAFTKADTLSHLMKAGYLSETGRLAVGDTVRTFISTFGEAFPDERMKYMCSTEKNIMDALRNLMRPDRAVFPLYCILLSWMAQERACSKQRKSVSVSSTHRRTLSPVTEDQVRMAMAEHGSLRAASTALNVNIKKLTALCLLHGIPFARRTKTLDVVLVENIHAAFDARQTPAQIVRRFGVSLSTAHWIRSCRADLAELKEHRVQQRVREDKALWEQVVRASPGATTTALKLMNYSLWARLRRNSKSWLEDHGAVPALIRGPRRSCRSMPLEPTVNRVIAKVAAASEKGGRRPEWKTLGRLQRATGMTEYELHRLYQLSALKKYLETKASFVHRRLIWGNATPERFKLWKIARKAGLRESTIRFVQHSFMKNYDTRNSED